MAGNPSRGVGHEAGKGGREEADKCTFIKPPWGIGAFFHWDLGDLSSLWASVILPTGEELGHVYTSSLGEAGQAIASAALPAECMEQSAAPEAFPGIWK